MTEWLSLSIKSNMNSPIPILNMNFILIHYKYKNGKPRWFYFPSTLEIIPIIYKPSKRRKWDNSFLWYQHLDDIKNFLGNRKGHDRSI